MIQVKRVYERPAKDDGARILVDRVWPRGVKKEALQLDGWLKDVAPSDRLRRWFGHKAARWEEFRHRYFSELDESPEAWKPILELARWGNVTLVYGARDRENNNAVTLRGYLMAKLKRG